MILNVIHTSIIYTYIYIYIRICIYIYTYNCIYTCFLFILSQGSAYFNCLATGVTGVTGVSGGTAASASGAGAANGPPVPKLWWMVASLWSLWSLWWLLSLIIINSLHVFHIPHSVSFHLIPHHIVVQLVSLLFIYLHFLCLLPSASVSKGEAQGYARKQRRRTKNNVVVTQEIAQNGTLLHIIYTFGESENSGLLENLLGPDIIPLTHFKHHSWTSWH